MAMGCMLVLDKNYYFNICTFICHTFMYKNNTKTFGKIK